MSRSGYGLVRAEQSGLLAETGKMLSGAPVHIVVVMLGMNDRISVRTETGHVQPGSAEWKELYGKEAEKLIKKLRNANVAVYWVGLPPMSNSSLNEFIAGVNNSDPASGLSQRRQIRRNLRRLHRPGRRL